MADRRSCRVAPFASQRQDLVLWQAVYYVEVLVNAVLDVSGWWVSPAASLGEYLTADQMDVIATNLDLDISSSWASVGIVDVAAAIVCSLSSSTTGAGATGRNVTSIDGAYHLVVSGARMPFAHVDTRSDGTYNVAMDCADTDAHSDGTDDVALVCAAPPPPPAGPPSPPPPSPPPAGALPPLSPPPLVRFAAELLGTVPARDVAGDTFCQDYAILASLGLLHHDSGAAATKHDRQLTQRLRQREVEWMHARNQSAVARSGHSWLVRFEGPRQVDCDPNCYLPPDVYVADGMSALDVDCYGDAFTLAAASAVLGVDIVSVVDDHRAGQRSKVDMFTVGKHLSIPAAEVLERPLSRSDAAAAVAAQRLDRARWPLCGEHRFACRGHMVGAELAVAARRPARTWTGHGTIAVHWSIRRAA
jgi:hypothetical protein